MDSGRAQTKPCVRQETGEGAVSSQETESDLPMSVQSGEGNTRPPYMPPGAGDG